MRMKLAKHAGARRVLLLFVLALILTAAPFEHAGFLGADVVQAAVKNGLVEIRLGNGESDYKYYVNGKAVKRKWKKVTASNGKSYWYYFGGNGKAYKAYATPVSMLYKERFVPKKIGDRIYGFDEFGHRVKGAWYSVEKNRIYFFDGNGIYNKAKTAKLRTYAKKGRKARYLINALQNYTKKTPRRVVQPGGCFEIGSEFDNGSRLIYYTFEHLQVAASTDTSGKTETVLLVDGLFR